MYSWLQLCGDQYAYNIRVVLVVPIIYALLYQVRVHIWGGMPTPHVLDPDVTGFCRMV